MHTRLYAHLDTHFDTHSARPSLAAPAAKRWSRSRARCICPRRHLRVLPIRTRPSLFGGD
jgi:hypothetical protein